MVGHRFVEALRDRDRDGTSWRVVVLCEEPDRGLRPGRRCPPTSAAGTAPGWRWPETTTPATIWSNCASASRPSRSTGEAHVVAHVDGRRPATTRWCWPLVRTPFVPPIPGSELPALLRLPHAGRPRRHPGDGRGSRPVDRAAGVVVGGGLLGLEAANALRLLRIAPHVVERSPRLMPHAGRRRRAERCSTGSSPDSASRCTPMWSTEAIETHGERDAACRCHDGTARRRGAW